MRRAARRDDNEPEIVAALERWGFTVQRLSDEAIPDLLAARQGDPYVSEAYQLLQQEDLGLAGYHASDRLDIALDRPWIILVEVKRPNARRKSGHKVPAAEFERGGRFAGLDPRLSEVQAEWHQRWPGRVYVADSPEGLARDLGLCHQCGQLAHDPRECASG